MITGEQRSQIDRIWNAFWTGSISNPLTVIEQMRHGWMETETLPVTIEALMMQPMQVPVNA